MYAIQKGMVVCLFVFVFIVSAYAGAGNKAHTVKRIPHRIEFEFWRCTTMNARIESFIGMGKTRARAIGNSMKYCANNSFGSNCVLLGCGRQE